MAEMYEGQIEFLKIKMDKYRTEATEARRNLSILRCTHATVVASRNALVFMLDRIYTLEDTLRAEKNYEVSDRLRELTPPMYQDRSWITGDDWTEDYRKWLKEINNEP